MINLKKKRKKHNQEQNAQLRQKVEVLREKIEEKLNPKPKIVMNEESLASNFKFELIHFSNLLEFVHWYEQNLSVFTPTQQQPLNSLIEARKITLGGCNCDILKRKAIAEDYFRKFWLNNKTTDLLPTLQKSLNTKKLIFGDFLTYPE